MTMVGTMDPSAALRSPEEANAMAIQMALEQAPMEGPRDPAIPPVDAALQEHFLAWVRGRYPDAASKFRAEIGGLSARVEDPDTRRPGWSHGVRTAAYRRAELQAALEVIEDPSAPYEAPRAPDVAAAVGPAIVRAAWARYGIAGVVARGRARVAGIADPSPGVASTACPGLDVLEFRDRPGVAAGLAALEDREAIKASLGKLPRELAAALSAVVRAAGGPDALATAVAEVRLLDPPAGGMERPADQPHERLRGEIAGIDRQLEVLGVRPHERPVGRMAAALVEKRRLLAKELADALIAVRRRATGDAAGLVNSLAGGDVDAVVMVASLAHKRADAFPPGFFDAIKAATWKALEAAGLDGLGRIDF